VDGLAVLMQQKIHHHFFGVPINKLGTNPNLVARFDILRVEALNELAGITEKKGRIIFSGFADRNRPEFGIEAKENNIGQDNRQAFRVYAGKYSVVFTTKGRDGGGAEIDIAVDTAGEMNAQKWVADIRHRIDIAID